MDTLDLIKQAEQDNSEARKSVEQHIKCDPEIMDGLPVFVGTRVPVHIVLECLAEGMNSDEIIRAFPTITHEHINAVLRFSGLLAKLH